MTSRQKARPSSTQNTDKCVHTASSSGMCQCKIEMEKKFQDFKILTGDIFKEQLQENLNERTKQLRNFSDNSLRENFKLKKDIEKVDVLQKLYDNVSRQVSLHETLIAKQKVDISNFQSTVDGLTGRNEELQVTVDGVTERNKEFQVTVDGLTERNKEVSGQNEELQVTVDGLTERNKEFQVSVDGLTERNKELQVTVDGLTERNKEFQVTVSELQAAIKEMQNRMKVVENKSQ